LQQIEQQLAPEARRQAQQTLARETQARMAMTPGASNTLALDVLQDDENDVDGEDAP